MISAAEARTRADESNNEKLPLHKIMSDILMYSRVGADWTRVERNKLGDDVKAELISLGYRVKKTWFDNYIYIWW